MKKRFSEEQIIGFCGKLKAVWPSRSYAADTGFPKQATTCGAASSAA